MQGHKRKSRPKHILDTLRAMRAEHVPMGEHGLWRVVFEPHSKALTFGSGFAVALYRTTEATLHLGHGDLVMIDHIIELQKHLEFVRRAHGRVLITGLGLGCVIRGLLYREQCTEIVVIERDPSVIHLVWPSLADNPLLTLVHADARDWTTQNTQQFDYAWHDLWVDTDQHETHLQVMHGEMMAHLMPYVAWQGAWAWPRYFKRGPRRWPQLVG